MIHTRNKDLTIIFSIALYLFFLIAFFTYLFHTSFINIIHTIQNTFYKPSANYCMPPHIGNINILTMLYYLIVIESFVILIFYIIGKVKRYKKQIVSIKTLIIAVLIVNWIGLTSMQQLGRYKFYKSTFNLIKQKTKDEKEKIYYGRLYDFSLQSKKVIKGQHRADFLTDLNCGTDPCMISHRMLSYLLYPEISIRFDNGKKNDTIILFYKNNPDKILQNKGYKMLVNNNNNIILGIKD